jgi:hypothetical protein
VALYKPVTFWLHFNFEYPIWVGQAVGKDNMQKWVISGYWVIPGYIGYWVISGYWVITRSSTLYISKPSSNWREQIKESMTRNNDSVLPDFQHTRRGQRVVATGRFVQSANSTGATVHRVTDNEVIAEAKRH